MEGTQCVFVCTPTERVYVRVRADAGFPRQIIALLTLPA